jgi:uncharacterized Zn-binding protein involved in type VI secretion
MRPLARIGDPCISPMGIPGKIVAGAPDSAADGLFIARMGDAVVYANGTASVIAEGTPAYTVGGRPAACMGHLLADGGRILRGSSGVWVGTPSSAGAAAQAAALTRAAASGRPYCAACGG